MRDHDDTVNEVLSDSDAVCEGCGADPRDVLTDDFAETPRAQDLSGWYFDIEYDTAIVLCPSCVPAPAVREEQTNLGPQTLVAGTPARTFPETPLRARKRQAELSDTPLFGQERAEVERAQEELPL